MTKNAPLSDRIYRNPAICHGRPCIRGTRVMVITIKDCIRVGMSPRQVVESYPSITKEDIKAALAYKEDSNA